MAEARLASGVWVSAYLTRLGQENIPAYVVAHGDDTAGAVMVKCAFMDGSARLYAREWNFETDSRAWHITAEASEAEIDETIRRQRSFDPDIWVIEIENREGRTLLDQPGLE